MYTGDDFCENVVISLINNGRTPLGSLPRNKISSFVSYNKNANRHTAIHLDDATIMIVGAGGIGQEVGRLCKAFNMKVIGVDPKFEKLKYFDKLITQKEIDKEIPKVDILVSTVMHTPETHYMFNLELFKKMKKTSIFINVGRGKTTSLDDLVNALEIIYTK